MSFVAPKLLWLVGNPANLLLLLLCISLVLLPTRWRRLGRRLGTAVLILLLLVGILPIERWLVTPLENRFPPPASLPSRVDGIIALGGSSDLNVSEARGQITVGESAERLLAFATLAHRYPGARLAFSGGSSALDPGRLREADIAARLFDDLGLDPSRILFDRKARTTFENANNLRALIGPTPGETWLLVTSAWHMPRAVGTFRHAGWDVIPYPVDFRTTGRGGIGLNFNIGAGLVNLHFAGREWAGLVFYWLSGRTDTLLPGPAGRVRAGPGPRMPLSTERSHG